MYLITIEGGDGSGKGIAARVVCDILEREKSFTAAVLTAEPRRKHPLGRSAINAVKEKKHTPEHEAKLFALDRLDHGLNWIMPKLHEGCAVVSDRNIHSSLVYQGVVGGIGVRNVALLNAGALVPDLCIWIDCDPEIAIKRIQSGSLRDASPGKTEYFETLDIQKTVRSGYQRVFSGDSLKNTPFESVEILGPINNNSSIENFTKELTRGVRKFLRARPVPRNTDLEDLDLGVIKRIIEWNSGQMKLPGFENETERSRIRTPWELTRDAEKTHLASISTEVADNIPRSIHSKSIYSVMSSIALISYADLNEIISAMGPSRAISKGHTNRVIRHFSSQGEWARISSTSRAESSHFRVTKTGSSIGAIMLVLSPLRSKIRLWRSRKPNTSYKHLISGLLSMGIEQDTFRRVSNRISLLYPSDGYPINDDHTSHVEDWWHGKITYESSD
tara:strand:+ start:6000 stop:7337 length:1338 start_codon:yes stop_codon:yes gene_type:complete